MHTHIHVHVYTCIPQCMHMQTHSYSPTTVLASSQTCLSNYFWRLQLPISLWAPGQWFSITTILSVETRSPTWWSTGWLFFNRLSSCLAFFYQVLFNSSRHDKLKKQWKDRYPIKLVSHMSTIIISTYSVHEKKSLIQEDFSIELNVFVWNDDHIPSSFIVYHVCK